MNNKIKIIGQKFKSKMCNEFTVLEKIPNKKGVKYLIEFDEINGIKHQTTTEKKHILSGGIKNPYFPLKLGVASIGNINTKEHVKEFNKWRAMIDRCYDINNNHYNTYGGKGIKVYDRWLCFEFFYEDLKQLKGYDEEKMKNGELYLDKDIIGDRKMYSPENCILTSNEENLKEMNKRTKQRWFKATRIIDGYEEICNNQSEFARKINDSNVSNCLRGVQKTCRGWKFEYINEEEINYEN